MKAWFIYQYILERFNIAYDKRVYCMLKHCCVIHSFEHMEYIAKTVSSYQNMVGYMEMLLARKKKIQGELFA